MSNELEIRTLTTRFFDGETSLAEEQRLYELYRTATELPADLAPLREMMEDWASLSRRLSPLPLPHREGSNYSPNGQEVEVSRCQDNSKWEKDGLSTPLPHREGQGGESSAIGRFAIRFLSLAASLLLLVGVAAAWYQQARQNECVAYVYGERVTDRTLVMQEMHSAMATLNDDEATEAMEAQLKDLFSE